MSRPTIPHPREDSLHAYLDGEIPQRQVEELERHLRSCSTCAAKLASLRLLFSQIDSVSEARLEVDLVPRVLQTIGARKIQDPNWGRVLAIQLLVFSGVLILFSGTLLTQAEQVLMFIQNWLGQSGIQTQIGILFQWFQATIIQFQPEVPGVLELSFPRPFFPSLEIGWALVGLGACLAWILANHWLLVQESSGEINPRQGA